MICDPLGFGLIQTEAYGGREIYFDDVLIRKDGLLLPELEGSTWRDLLMTFGRLPLRLSLFMLAT